jgi:metal-responsive CopG/Arc/MetJ family transcriptional regulator
MQIIVDLDDQLVARIKRVAIEHGKSLNELMEEALRGYLARWQRRNLVELPIVIAMQPCWIC